MVCSHICYENATVSLLCFVDLHVIQYSKYWKHYCRMQGVGSLSTVLKTMSILYCQQYCIQVFHVICLKFLILTKSEFSQQIFNNLQYLISWKSSGSRDDTYMGGWIILMKLKNARMWNCLEIKTFAWLLILPKNLCSFYTWYVMLHICILTVLFPQSLLEFGPFCITLLEMLKKKKKTNLPLCRPRDELTNYRSISSAGKKCSSSP